MYWKNRLGDISRRSVIVAHGTGESREMKMTCSRQRRDGELYYTETCDILPLFCSHKVNSIVQTVTSFSPVRPLVFTSACPPQIRLAVFFNLCTSDGVPTGDVDFSGHAVPPCVHTYIHRNGKVTHTHSRVRRGNGIPTSAGSYMLQTYSTTTICRPSLPVQGF